MRTRRQFLTACGASATVVGLGGCANILPGSEGGQEQTDDIFPPDGLETDDELLTSVADPSLQVPPRFVSGYQYRLATLEEEYDLTTAVPRLGGEFLSVLETDIEGLGIRDCERITGSSYYGLWNTGPLGNPVPSGQTVHVTGSFGQDSVVDWLDSVDGYRSIGSDHSAERYIADILRGRGFETWAVRDGLVVIVSRSDVTGRTDRYETNEEAATEALALEFNQIEREDAPIANTAPAFANVAQALEEGPIRGGAAYALIPQGADTGTASFDAVVPGIVGGGVSAQTGAEPTLQRAISYLGPEMADSNRLRAAYADADTLTVPVDQWSFSTDGNIAQARASVEGRPEEQTLTTTVPVPGYTNYTNRIAPGNLNRTPNPRAIFEGSVADGRITLDHTSGDTVEDLRVRYVNDGSVTHEGWSGPVAQGDSFESNGEPDTGTHVWLTWRPETADAAVLLHFRNE